MFPTSKSFGSFLSARALLRRFPLLLWMVFQLMLWNPDRVMAQVEQNRMFLTQSTTSVMESPRALPIVFRIHLTYPAEPHLAVRYQVLASSAQGAHYGVDYVADPVTPVSGGRLLRPGLVEFDPGSTVVELRFRVVVDKLYEPDQDFMFSVYENSRVGFLGSSPDHLRVVITDSEPRYNRLLARATVLRGSGTQLTLWKLNAAGVPTVPAGDFRYIFSGLGGATRSLALARLGREFDFPTVVLGTGGGGALGRVSIYSLTPAREEFQYSWLPYGDFPGPVSVAAGDVDGDGMDEIITGAGPGGGPHVQVWKLIQVAHGEVLHWELTLVRSWFAFDSAFTGGVRVAAGDVDGDGRADIITAMGPGSFPYVVTQSGATGVNLPGASYFAYGLDFTGGVYVTAADLDGDGRAEIITGAGAGGGRHIRAYHVATSSWLIDRIEPGDATGVQVAALPFPRRDGNLEVGGIFYGEPAGQFPAFRPTSADNTSGPAPRMVTVGPESILNDRTDGAYCLAAYQMAGKPPYVYDFSTPEPTLEVVSSSATEIRYRYPTVKGRGYDLFGSTTLAEDSWQRKASVEGDGGMQEYIQPLSPGLPRHFLRLDVTNWSYQPIRLP